MDRITHHHYNVTLHTGPHKPAAWVEQEAMDRAIDYFGREPDELNIDVETITAHSGSHIGMKIEVDAYIYTEPLEG